MMPVLVRLVWGELRLQPPRVCTNRAERNIYQGDSLRVESFLAVNQGRCVAKETQLLHSDGCLLGPLKTGSPTLLPGSENFQSEKLRKLVVKVIRSCGAFCVVFNNVCGLYSASC